MSSAVALLKTDHPYSTSDAERLGAEIAELCSYIYAAQSRLLSLIREFDEKRHWEKLGLCSCAHWLNFKCGVGMNAAREKLRVAHALAALPKISKQFEQGRLSYSKIRAMTRIADENNEDYLLMIAEHSSLIVKALEMAMDTAFAEKRTPVDTSGDNNLSAATPNPTPDNGAEPEPIAVRRADALANIAETYLNNSKSSGSTADRYQVVVHVGVSANDKCHLEDGPGVSADQVPSGQTFRRIACDSSIVAIQEKKNGDGEIIFKDQRQQPLEPSAPLPGIPADEDIQAWFDTEFFAANIDSDTCKTRWHAGETMDWQTAVSALF